MGSLPPKFSSSWCLLLFICCFHLVGRSQRIVPSTVPKEAAAVKAIFRKLKAPMNWNTTSDPCSGHAVDGTDIENQHVNSLIVCDCSANNNTVCHVTKLKISSLGVTGPIPQELQNLTYLNNLKLNQNYLTGSLPPFIGKLTNLQYISFGVNALSGTIPKEIGNLNMLISLGISTNNFSGPLSSEIGLLANLEKLYVNSNGFSGEIPPTLAKLQKLKTLWAFDNNFTGKIPDFIGEFTNLTDLRLHGNPFQGPIPSNFVNLVNLESLRIGDVTNGSSSLDFIKNMKSLTTLVLRNANLSAVIPSSIGEYARLNLLDLSFNNLTGFLPTSLFNMSQLKFLFLGNNNLSGGLPTFKSGTLQIIDLSYNNLSGDFPSWVGEPNLQLNLVANNFKLSDSNNSSNRVQGLECLQKNIPCSRGSPTWSSFAINCGGGKSIMGSDQFFYEKDNENLSAASYYVTPDKRWAVSNVGRFLDAPNAAYAYFSSSQLPNSLDQELFQSLRLSPSSLRYYGLGLENGNYTVKLQFVELEAIFADPPNWRSTGRRIFDIYVQGNLMQKNFDIKEEAGGRANVAVIKEFVANVTENFLEIHFFWAGKGTCCVPSPGNYGPSISAISVKPNFTPTVRNQPSGTTSSKGSNMTVIIGPIVGVVAFIFLLISAVYMWRKIKRGGDGDDEELSGMDVKSEIFSYAELRAATEDFNPSNKLGQGGFGAVFKGKLSDGRVVAVKQFFVASHHGKTQFVTEIETITAVQHRNLVKLLGCCFEGNNRLLVYEYLENKSLDQALFGNNGFHLNWSSRFGICLGAARGLAYLHEESSARIVHRDIKASNILLDADLQPKISDFGLAKLFDDKKTHISTRIAGTIGYVAPEYALRGRLTEKADVFGFGVVALEIVSGRPNTDATLSDEMVYLLEWAWHLYENNLELELVDPKLKSYERDEVIRVVRIALLCTQTSPSLRPSMSKAVSMLTGDAPLSNIISKPTYLTEWQLKDTSSGTCMSEVSSSESREQTTSSQLGVSSTEKSLIGQSSSPGETCKMLRDAIAPGR